MSLTHKTKIEIERAGWWGAIDTILACQTPAGKILQIQLSDPKYVCFSITESIQTEAE